MLFHPARDYFFCVYFNFYGDWRTQSRSLNDLATNLAIGTHAVAEQVVKRVIARIADQGMIGVKVVVCLNPQRSREVFENAVPVGLTQ